MRTSMETKPAKNAGVATVRCAIYTRKSSEQGLEQEFNSLHAQRESGEAYVASMKHEGWVALPDQYNDGGLSRPARLIASWCTRSTACRDRSWTLPA